MCIVQTPPSRVRSTMSIHKETSHTDLCADKQEPHGAPLNHTDLLGPSNAKKKETIKKTILEPVGIVMLLPKISIGDVKQTRKESVTQVNGNYQNLKRKITPRKLADECERSLHLQEDEKKEEEHIKLIACLSLAKLKEMLKDERKPEQKLRKLTEHMMEHHDMLEESDSDQDSVVVISSCTKWYE